MQTRFMTEIRRHRLLACLDEQDFRPPPPSIGEKTLTRAQQERLIELRHNGGKPVARLTPAGKRWREEQTLQVITWAGHAVQR